MKAGEAGIETLKWILGIVSKRGNSSEMIKDTVKFYYGNLRQNFIRANVLNSRINNTLFYTDTAILLSTLERPHLPAVIIFFTRRILYESRMVSPTRISFTTE
jgi:hypothetical protein